MLTIGDELDVTVLDFRDSRMCQNKDELILGGRFDLVKRIVSQGGWLSYCWDLDIDEEQDVGVLQDFDFEEKNDSRMFQNRFYEDGIGINGGFVDDASSSGRMGGEKDDASCGDRELITDVDDNENSSLMPQSLSKGLLDDPVDADKFEEKFIRNDESVARGTKEAGNLRTQLSICDKIEDYKQIKSHIQVLEVELASVLNLLSHKRSDTGVSDKNSSEESHSISDAWEFRETEIIKARDKLRSLRAQVVVLEGRMALRIIKAQMMVDQKQKEVCYAQRAPSLLRTASVTWHKSASEVLLVGSFDGWTSQRKMKKSSPDIFQMHLRLYPGRYEIKFIVDGVWMIDPLRPVVNTEGHLNNLLIVS